MKKYILLRGVESITWISQDNNVKSNNQIQISYSKKERKKKKSFVHLSESQYRLVFTRTHRTGLKF